MSSELRFVQLNGVVFQNEAKILALCVTCLLLEKIYDFLKYIGLFRLLVCYLLIWAKYV